MDFGLISGTGGSFFIKKNYWGGFGYPKLYNGCSVLLIEYFTRFSHFGIFMYIILN